MNDSNSFKADRATLVIYYKEPPYDTKIAEIRQNGSMLAINILEQDINGELQKVISKIAQDKLEYSFCTEKKNIEGEEIAYYKRTVAKGDKDYLIGLYWAVLESHEKINGKSLMSRLLDENGKVIGKFGRRLTP